VIKFLSITHLVNSYRSYPCNPARRGIFPDTTWLHSTTQRTMTRLGDLTFFRNHHVPFPDPRCEVLGTKQQISTNAGARSVCSTVANVSV